MPFSKERRLWYLRAWGNGDPNQARCQYRLYSEKSGFYLACQQRGLDLFVVRWTVAEWGTVGIPFCRHHFMEQSNNTPFVDDTVVYPELAEAVKGYRDNKQSFDNLTPFSPSHRTRFGDLGTDIYYFQYGQSVVSRYATITHPNDRPPPDTRGHHYPSWTEWTDLIPDDF